MVAGKARHLPIELFEMGFMMFKDQGSFMSGGVV